ncbi:MAG: STAS/SEC14 domain-containing protein [Gammaproteobacteria bacterium]|nr:MAG: STAS/SEC14 domain-containing protein [Gammaproteobacteria bacterium]
MNEKEHGITIGISRIGNHFYLKMKAVGKLTHQDYEVITPMIDEAVLNVEAPEINALFDATEFEGWELRAAWDDLRLGLKHGKEFSKLAIVGNKPWEKHMSKIADWFVTGEVEYFEKYQEAVNWLEKEQV